MKHIAFIIILSLVASCKEKHAESAKNDTVVVYSLEDWFKNKDKKVKVVDTLCISEEKRAREDIASKKWTYTFLYGLVSYDYSNTEMKALLSKHSIALAQGDVSCIRPPEGFRWRCYEKLMNAAIEDEFGKNFIDSLRHIADVSYIKNHPKQIFSFYECDTESRYSAAKSYDDFLKMPEDDFIKTLNYPGLTKEQQQKLKANTEVTFIIYKNGTVGNISVRSDFSIANNKEFARYFEARAIAFVKKAKWKPALYRGIPVNSDMDLNLYNK
ncbi:energy transducer TonB [Flavobacterium akiainvivens]|uniref:energy transducer TonB n=1 Tax=Flavobacterium akiainvivens TaxID=1202724 RepID=UPI0011606D47|nr:hypothetical protein [Flavobacterium akiainvivens]